MKNKNKYVFIVEKGWYHEGGECIAVVKSLFEAKAIRDEFYNNQEKLNFDPEFEYVKIIRWRIGEISKSALFDMGLLKEYKGE